MLQQTSQHGYLVTVIHTCVLTDITVWISGYCDTHLCVTADITAWISGYCDTHLCVTADITVWISHYCDTHLCVTADITAWISGYCDTHLCVTDNSDMISENGIVLFAERTEAQPGLPAAVSGQGAVDRGFLVQGQPAEGCSYMCTYGH